MPTSCMRPWRISERATCSGRATAPTPGRTLTAGNCRRATPRHRDFHQHPATLYVSNDAEVFVSENSGGAWQNLTRNLPTSPIVDLVLHDADATLTAATYGAASGVSRFSCRSAFRSALKPFCAPTKMVGTLWARLWLQGGWQPFCAGLVLFISIAGGAGRFAGCLLHDA